MKVCIEATSMLGRRSGVGHTTASLVEALVDARPDLEIVLLPVSARGAGGLRRAAPVHPRVTALRTRVPARLTSWVWQRSTWPPAELFCGAVDVFHGPNFMLPPLLKAAGVVTIHDLAFEVVPETCSEHVLTYGDTVPVAAGRANRIVVPSEAVAAELAAWLPEEAARIRVVHPGVRDTFAVPGGPLTAPRRDALGIRSPYAAFVGNLELRKNLDGLLEAFAIVRTKHPEAQLVCVGSPGTGWEEIAARHEGLLAEPGAVVRTGYLPDAEVAAIVRGADVFVYPSRYEGFGMPPVEALAAGTPVVASTAAALREALGGHASLVDPDDVDGLASAVSERLDAAPETAAVDAARRWAQGFTWARAAELLLEVYAEAVEEVAG